MQADQLYYELTHLMDSHFHFRLHQPMKKAFKIHQSLFNILAMLSLVKSSFFYHCGLSCIPMLCSVRFRLLHLPVPLHGACWVSEQAVCGELVESVYRRASFRAQHFIFFGRELHKVSFQTIHPKHHVSYSLKEPPLWHHVFSQMGAL